ncbi:MAG TPA: RHS repeat-associated core domain-containing protein, partial [Gemmatimonadales bacterium]|nr:RHS repeat-associated core domain-containing protein [Gemmatimonadales bacterium]
TVGGTPSVEAATIPALSNRVVEIRDGGGVLIRELTWRTGGALEEDDRGTPEYEYLYNARGRLVTAKLGGATVGNYGYDAFGRRVSRQTSGTGAIARHYLFDPDGRLLAEHDAATGAVKKEYVWIDDTPVAVIDSSSGSPVILFIHAGQLDEPLAMTNGAKATVWNVRFEPFGRASVFGTPTADLDLRLPGQWLQDEMGGLHQNGFRDYDPTTGRYVEADPLGLSAGENVYSYADENPVIVTDPTGLEGPGFWNSPQTLGAWGRNHGAELAGLRDHLQSRRLWGHSRYGGRGWGTQIFSFIRHCTTTCVLSREVGTELTLSMGGINEAQGFLRHDVPNFLDRIRGISPWAFQLDDYWANQVGAEVEACLPTNLTTTELERSCFQECWKKDYMFQPASPVRMVLA